MNILLTGCAGFIGFSVAKMLLERGDTIYGIDNLNAYYDVNLKQARLNGINQYDNFIFKQLDITDHTALSALFTQYNIERVIHLAAQAGVRYSLENPIAYIDANIHGFINILEACRHNAVQHLTYASSSSVYGANTNLPFSVHDHVDHPLSLYAATKKSNELMAHSYSHLYQLPTTGLRFFTVYGPWGRPDMSLFLFTEKIINGQPIDVFNHGHHSRSFTYIDDVVSAVIATSDHIATSDTTWQSDAPDPATSKAPYKLYNIGNDQPIKLMDYIHILEKALDRRAKLNFLPLQAGDVPATQADISDLARDMDYRPTTSIEQGINNFVVWYKNYYGANRP